MSLESIRGYDAWKTRTPYDDIPDHVAKCPANPDADEIYSECRGHNECFCSMIEREINGCAPVEPECTCPTPAELALDAAEYRRDCEMDR